MKKVLLILWTAFLFLVWGGGLLRGDVRQWKPVASGTGATLRSVCFADPAELWTVGDAGTMLVSRDSGQSWQAAPAAGDGTMRSVHFLDSLHGAAVGDGDSHAPTLTQGHVVFGTGRSPKAGTFLFTSDGGKTWQARGFSTNFELRSVRVLSDKVACILAHGGDSHRDGDVYLSRDFSHWDQARAYRGLNASFWTDPQHGWAVGSRVSVGFRPEPDSDLYRLRSARIISTSDGGKSWKPVPTGRDLPGQLRSIAFADARTAVVVGDAGEIQRSTDSGSTWGPVPVPVTTDLLAVTFSDASHGWIVGAAGCILETHDAGASWIQCASPTTANLYSVAASPSAVIAVGEGGAVLRLK